MPNQASSLIEEVGIDYITATTLERFSPGGLASFGRHIVGEEVNAGAKLSTWRASGYRGQHTAHAAYGNRPDGQIVKLSSYVASLYWEQLFTLATNVTRLDLQVTVKLDHGPTKELRKHERSLYRKRKRRGRPFKFHIHRGPSGPETIELGRRQSIHWMRVYNKHLQSKLDLYRNCLRYELQLHDEEALRMAHVLSACEDQGAVIAERVHSFALARLKSLTWSNQLYRYLAARPSAPNECDLVRPLRRRQLSEASQKIMWARACLGPTAGRLIRAGRGKELLEALGFSDDVLAHLDQYKMLDHDLISAEVM